MSPKQETVYNRALELFDIDDGKKSRIRFLISTTYDIDYLKYTDEMIKELINDEIYDEDLFKKFIIPPFSILDTKQGVWRERRNLLDDYLGDSTIGRDSGLTYGDGLKYGEKDNGTSRFDSVLCEVILKWFGIKGSLVFDPYAGGLNRGCMASLCGYQYIGIDLNKDQIDANIKRYMELGLKNVEWHNDDSLNCDKYIKDDSADLLFTCPPYGDLEKYTDDPRDLSNMSYNDFIKVYSEIIIKSCLKLKDNRFAVFVVGDFRDKEGFYHGFVRDTITAFQNLGIKLYNELILLNSITTAAMRSNAQFRNRKMVKIHQNVLIFFKGDPRSIQSNYEKIDSRLPILQRTQSKLL